ncbi:hypothetical protein [Pseudomonas proteolytica]|uniref:hypothetical protein n=1 Tax=Pseudomonas proteolytica TaxID=219574 RepID=UPI0014730B0B|nr:hypothetical protein [Pseudomonas proteolytica]NMZ34008.1 hypothetical protein [Pseudomonas proteolytica]
MVFEIFTLGSVGPLNVGMDREKVREILGGGYHEFKKTLAADNTTDDYGVYRIHVYYDGDDKVKGVEFLSGSDVFWNGMKLVGEPSNVISEFFLNNGFKVEVDAAGFYVDELGMGFYAPDVEDCDVDAIIKSLYLDLSVS